jgi:hypothetical protein
VCPLFEHTKLQRRFSHEPTAFFCVALPALDNNIHHGLRCFQFGPNRIITA